MGLAPLFTILWLANHLADSGATPIGTVALSQPHCNVIVVLSRGAFSVLSEQSYVAVWEGDAIQGEFNEPGVHWFDIIRVMPIEMEVVAASLPLEQASDLFRHRCEPTAIVERPFSH
jgi:hypothetical protein